MPSTRKQQIADLVRQARLAKGLTQAQLADAVGVNINTISHIERAMHLPTRGGLMEKLEDALDTDLSAEAQVGHQMIEEIVRAVTRRMRELGPVEGLRYASDVLDRAEEWKPQRRRTDTPAEGATVISLDGSGPQEKT